MSLTDGDIRNINQNHCDPWKVHLIDTGQTTMTGGRLKRLAAMIKKGAFMMTYGNGVSDVNLDSLLKFHQSNKGLVTLTAVRPPARFGALEFEGNQIRHFKKNPPSMKAGSTGASLLLIQRRSTTSKKMSCGNTPRWKNWQKTANFTLTSMRASGSAWTQPGILSF